MYAISDCPGCDLLNTSLNRTFQFSDCPDKVTFRHPKVYYEFEGGRHNIDSSSSVTMTVNQTIWINLDIPQATPPVDVQGRLGNKTVSCDGHSVDISPCCMNGTFSEPGRYTLEFTLSHIAAGSVVFSYSVLVTGEVIYMSIIEK